MLGHRGVLLTPFRSDEPPSPLDCRQLCKKDCVWSRGMKSWVNCWLLFRLATLLLDDRVSPGMTGDRPAVEELLWSSGSLCPGAFAAMSWMRFWTPWFLVWLPLWLLVQAAQPPGWALDPVQLTPRPPGPTESWSSDPSNLPLELPHALTPHYLRPSALAQMFGPCQELTYTLVPFLYTGSAGELPPGPDHWDKPSQHRSLPEVVPVVSWDQNQVLDLPPRLKTETKTINVDHAEHQSFEIFVAPLSSYSSKPTRFIVSLPNPKKDLAQHRRLTKVLIGTPGSFAKKHLKQQLQDDYLDPKRNVVYAEEKLPVELLGGPLQRPEAPEEVEAFSQKSVPIHRGHKVEEAESFPPQVDSQDQHPESPEELEPLPFQQEASSQPPEPPETDENSTNLQAALAEPSYTPLEAEPPVQEEAPAQPPEPSNGAESSPTQQESPAQPPDPFEEVVA
ncbi:hypothetical protein MC885_010825 [Smutsia gigantea]|nr:hypothetical protein MC885_010825 [Smutsia gigantea]